VIKGRKQEQWLKSKKGGVKIRKIVKCKRIMKKRRAQLKHGTQWK